MNRMERAAITLYPELQRIVDLKRGGGWVFQPHYVDGMIELLAGHRVWLVGGWNDAIAIRDAGDATAYRCEGLGGEVWDREGSLAYVIDELVELPAPDEPGAPKLVRGRRPTLWVPGRP